MKQKLTQRLNQVLQEIISDRFLHGTGLGNEIAFYIFDYPPECELQVREYVAFLVGKVPQEKPGLKFKHINLFDFVLDYLKQRNLLDKSIAMQKEKGDDALLNALSGILHETKIAQHFSSTVKPADQDLIIISGVGSAYPLIRSHTLLNNLHTIMGKTPLIMFYPGNFDKTTLRLFGKTGLIGSPKNESLKSTNYYRAFKLVE